MKLTKLLLTGAGFLCVAAVAAYAGGLADAVVEAEPVIMTPDEPDGSLPGWVLPVALIALLVGAAALASDDDDDGPASTL